MVVPPVGIDFLMDLLFRHFALVLIAVVVVNTVVAQRRIPTFVAAGACDPAEAARFVRQVAGWFITLFLVLEVLTLTSGASSPLCFLPWPRRMGTMTYVAWGLWIGWTLAVTLWILVGKGAELVARNGPLFARNYRPGLRYHARTTRVLAIVWCIGTLAVPFLLPSERPSVLTCPQSTFSR